MVDIMEGSENVSVHGIFNWILLLAIFSVITVVGNAIGFHHPIGDSLVGMAILSLITLLGVWMERYLPLDISSIIYISVMGILLVVNLKLQLLLINMDLILLNQEVFLLFLLLEQLSEQYSLAS